MGHSNCVNWDQLHQSQQNDAATWPVWDEKWGCCLQPSADGTLDYIMEEALFKRGRGKKEKQGQTMQKKMDISWLWTHCLLAWAAEVTSEALWHAGVGEWWQGARAMVWPLPAPPQTASDAIFLFCTLLLLLAKESTVCNIIPVTRRRI